MCCLKYSPTAFRHGGASFFSFVPALLQSLFSPKRGRGSSDRKVMHACSHLYQELSFLFFDQYDGGRQCVGVLVDEFVSFHSWLIILWSRLLSSSFTGGLDILVQMQQRC